MSLIWVHKMTLSENVSVRLSRVRLFVSAWTIACQAPLSMEFSRQEYWSRLPFPSPGNLPDPGIESRSPALQADSLQSETPGKPNVQCNRNVLCICEVLHNKTFLKYRQKLKRPTLQGNPSMVSAYQ